MTIIKEWQNKDLHYNYDILICHNEMFSYIYILIVEQSFLKKKMANYFLSAIDINVNYN